MFQSLKYAVSPDFALIPSIFFSRRLTPPHSGIDNFQNIVLINKTFVKKSFNTHLEGGYEAAGLANRTRGRNGDGGRSAVGVQHV
ncbi:MAG: hypothetical protein P4M06_19595, partial [Pandoraea sp.]